MVTAPWLVLKFGGTSVRDRSCWDRIIAILQQKLALGVRLFLVLSAPRGVSDALSRIASGAGDHDVDVRLLQDIYQNLVIDLGLASSVDVAALLAPMHASISALGHENYSSKSQAEVMAYGELLLTKVAHAYLEQQGLPTLYLDARIFLQSDIDTASNAAQYLKSYCAYLPDSVLQNYLAQHPTQIIVTQGFIAANPAGHTVLLGRGGSDTSAAYFAAKLQAEVCEIWTDVAGIYTANPNVIPEARLLPKLDYEEAQEIALMGGKVLHPESLAPVREYNIPMHIKSSYQPELDGTIITNDISYKATSKKSIISKKGVVLIEMTAFAMWKQAGFLARIFALFQKYDVSVDLISTSEMNVTVTLDEQQQHCNPELLQRLLVELQGVCRAQLITSCASISLIGRNMRSMLHKLAGVFNIISEHQVYLISQAANDLNFSFVVDERLADRLVQKLHNLLLENTEANEYANDRDRALSQSMMYRKDDWWVLKANDLLRLMKTRRHAHYVYDLATCDRQIAKLSSVDAITKAFYAVKANHYPELLKLIYARGLGFECVSIDEVEFIFNLFPEIDPLKIIFTPNFVAGEEYVRAFALGVQVILDAIQPVWLWPEVFRGQSILLRVDPGIGTGHHRFVSTGGLESKFGMTPLQIKSLSGDLEKINCKVIGLHAHTGSGVLDRNHWSAIVKYLLEIRQEYFPKCQVINCGGGLGVAHNVNDVSLNMSLVNEKLHALVAADVELWWEPGRFLVAECGVLLTKVTQIKEKQGRTFIGLNTGMNSLIRPALYGAYHHIINLSKLHEPCVQRAHFVGPICESADCFGYERLVPKTEVGDVVLLSHVGAYGRSMSSNYNMRAPASELSI
jgi:diaminopimelate decarboxylase/aspartate kinase